PEIYTLSLHDALPIFVSISASNGGEEVGTLDGVSVATRNGPASGEGLDGVIGTSSNGRRRGLIRVVATSAYCRVGTGNLNDVLKSTGNSCVAVINLDSIAGAPADGGFRIGSLDGVPLAAANK